jgi:hypothetical protein
MELYLLMRLRLMELFDSYKQEISLDLHLVDLLTDLPIENLTAKLNTQKFIHLFIGIIFKQRLSKCRLFAWSLDGT